MSLKPPSASFPRRRSIERGCATGLSQRPSSEKPPEVHRCGERGLGLCDPVHLKPLWREPLWRDPDR